MGGNMSRIQDGHYRVSYGEVISEIGSKCLHIDNLYRHYKLTNLKYDWTIF